MKTLAIVYISQIVIIFVAFIGRGLTLKKNSKIIEYVDLIKKRIKQEYPDVENGENKDLAFYIYFMLEQTKDLKKIKDLRDKTIKDFQEQQVLLIEENDSLKKQLEEKNLEIRRLEINIYQKNILMEN